MRCRSLALLIPVSGMPPRGEGRHAPSSAAASSSSPCLFLDTSLPDLLLLTLGGRGGALLLQDKEGEQAEIGESKEPMMCGLYLSLAMQDFSGTLRMRDVQSGTSHN